MIEKCGALQAARTRWLGHEEEKILKGIRTLIVAYYLFISYYGLFKIDFTNVSHPTWKDMKHNWWKCLTVWNTVLQVRYFIMNFFIDYNDNLPKIEIIQKCARINKTVQDYCFIAIDVPLSVYVCALFWIVQTVSGPLFFPPEMYVYIPEWYNHAVHTNPLFLMLFQMIFQFHRNPPIVLAALGLVMQSIMYLTCMFYTRWTTGQWVYILLGEIVSSLPQAIIIFSISGFIIPLTILFICYKLNEYIWKD